MGSTAVIILNWNGAHHLEQFLPSVMESTPPQVDIVVADNGSTDSSLKLLEERFARVKTIALNHNYGFAQGYNIAIEQLDYEYIILLNSDVKVTPGWTTPLLDELMSSDSLGAVAPKILSVEKPEYFEHAGAAGGFIDYLGYPFCQGRLLSKVERDEGQYDSPRDIFWASGAAFACRAEVFKSFGGFSPHFFAHMEEIDLCWRMQLMGYTIRYQPQSVVYHLGGGTLPSSSPQKLYLNHRNNLAMLLHCAPPRQLLVVMILRPALDIAAAVSYLFKGGVKAFAAPFRAYFSVVAAMGRLLKERHNIRTKRRCESTQIAPFSILLNALLRRG